MMKEKGMSLVALILISAVMVTTTFQNCAKVNYQLDQKNNATTSQSVMTKTAQINPSFNPENADMKVLFVVDDSFTMSQSQQRLSNALDSLLDPLEGRNVDFKIVSTSGLPNNMIDYDVETNVINSNTSEHTVKNSVNNRHALLRSLAAFNASQFSSLKSQIKNAVLSVGTNGSDTEEGFCAAVRQLYDTSANRFFQPGDKAAIIFLSDENDSSAFNNCLAQYKVNTQANQVIVYTYNQQRVRLNLEYKVDRDGLEFWYPATWEVPLSTPNQFANNAACNTADMNAALQKMTDLGYQVRNTANCTYVLSAANFYGADLGDDGSNASKNLCTSTVTFNGNTWTNLYSYITASNYSAQSGSCQKQTYSASTISPATDWTSVVASDSAALNSQDLMMGLVNKSNELFGTGYIVASIIRKQGESCALQSGQSYGTKYIQLSDRLGSRGVTESLCASSFTSVLSQVSQFIKTESTKSYVVPNMSSDESIMSVVVRRNGQEIKLTTSQFEAVGSTLTLTQFSLQQGDLIEVTYGK